MDCYIYYQSRCQDQALILAAVQTLRTLLPSPLKEKFQLQRRPIPRKQTSSDETASDVLITWMEIYHDIPDDFENLLQEIVVKSSIEKWTVAERKMEYFIPVLPAHNRH